MKKTFLAFIAATALLAGCRDTNKSDDASAPAILAPAVINYSLVKVYPHDTSSYTQGLIWQNNTMYEGTGWRGVSKLRTVDINTGKPIKQISLPDTVFGEGIAILNNKIYQLTYQEHKVYVYDLSSFKKLQEFEWPYEGWGLTTNGKQLIISTGDSNLYFVNPENFHIERTVGVSDNNGYVPNLNELEYVNGSIYANVYETDYIIKINPETGHVDGKVDMSSLLQKAGATYDPRQVDAGYVLNGIAYDAAKNSFYITGKRWPILCEVKFN
ncbi:Glutamine cyclotransferase [Hydrobacter penzbergensis]|uniref:Glutamine cyclotransferase n=1 Tax=Hydrobacter penzbergensis TaxID=1235997 RepID=A0A8X8IGW2_9BACT|nr:glutaminyl-peptide cyclotransferase [Hydrobacter penzbergensis]SDX33029.1 Glutamine cyclotransferase [Hydrobacter penzbergensis]